jgi:Transglycosylase SLT domain
MPRTPDWRRLSNPFDVIEALKASASYLRDLRNRFGNLGLAAAAYNASCDESDQFEKHRRLKIIDFH